MSAIHNSINKLKDWRCSMIQEQKYLTEIELSQLSGISLSQLRNNRYKGLGIPYSKLGKSVRYSLQDVVEYIELRKINTNQDALPTRT